MKINRYVTLAIVTIGLGAMTSFAQEVKITKNHVPHSVVDAFVKTYPYATMTGFNREKEHGKTYYEIESRDGKRHRDVLYTKAGNVVEVEEAVSIAEMPKAVRFSLQKQFTGAKIYHIDRSIRGGATHYEVLLARTPYKKKMEVAFDVHGKHVTDEE